MRRDFPREVKRADHATSDALLTEAVKALEEIAQAKMPGQARSIAHATLSKIKAERAE